MKIIVEIGKWYVRIRKGEEYEDVADSIRDLIKKAEEKYKKIQKEKKSK